MDIFSTKFKNNIVALGKSHMKMNLICAHYIRNGLNMCKRYVVNHVNHVNNDEKEVLNNTSLTCTLEN